MMIGNYPNPTVYIPPWTSPDDPMVEISSPISGNADDYYPFDTLHRYLPSNDDVLDSEGSGRDSDLLTLEAYSCEQFRMYEFKVRKCTRGRSHDWTECPFAHPGEKARRRDPRKYHYSGTACPEYRKGICKKGDNCEFAHGVFECWLHPSRYRTQPCKDGLSCRRRVCFFAHLRDQLRVLSPSSPNQTESYDGSPQRLALEASFFKTLPFLASSPDSGSSPSDSPPMTNSLSRSVGLNSVNEVVASLRQLQLSKVKSSPSSWGLGLNLGSPRMSMTRTRPVFSSLPSTPSGIGSVDIWERGGYEEEEEEEEPVMERVESGRDLRAKLFEKLSRENPLDQAGPERCPITSSDPDVGWVSELV